MDVTALPTWQDCHELWSKKRKRDQRVRENQSKTNESSEPAGGLVTHFILFLYHYRIKYIFNCFFLF